MIYHVLNGDALAERFDLDGERVVCRECLIDGDVRVGSLAELWRVRADFVKREFGADDYFEKVKAEFDKLNRLTPDDEVNLWFGDDAFCLLNLSFIIWAFGDENATFYRVFPDGENWNCGYHDLSACFGARRKLSPAEISVAKQLWPAFQGERTKLAALGLHALPGFPGFKEVCAALSEIDSRPKNLLREITSAGITEFSEIFRLFRENAAVYGFGDAQVKRLLAEL